MKNSCLDLLGLAGIPEVLSQITAGSSGDIHFRMILVVTLRALPFHIIIDHDLTIIATDVAIIGFGVELTVLDIIVNKTDDFLDGFHIIGQVRYFHVRDSSAQRLILELTLDLELGESVDLLPDIHMIGICVISLIGDIGNITVFSRSILAKR